MPGITVDLDFPKDPRVRKLVRNIGEERAYAMLLRGWMLAAWRWGDGRKLITELEADAEDLHPLIDAGLAERQPNGIYVKGVKKTADWLADMREKRKEGASKGGKKRAESAQRTGGRFTKAELVTDLVNHQPTLVIHQPPTRSDHRALVLSLSPVLKQSAEESASGGDLVLSSPPSRRLAPADLFEIWNAHCGELPKARAMKASSERYRHAQARIREDPNPATWIERVKRVAASSFCNGVNDRGWKFEIDDLLNSDKLMRLDEGKYDRAFKAQTGTRKRTPQEIADDIAKRYPDTVDANGRIV